MNRPCHILRTFLRTFLLVIGTIFPALGASADTRIAVVIGQEERAYEGVVAGFQSSLSQQGINTTVDQHALPGDTTKVSTIFQSLTQNRPDLILAVGMSAIRATLKESKDIPIVAALAVNGAELQHADNITGVVINFPIEVQFQWLQKFLPQYKSIGVLFNPVKSQESIDSAIKVAGANGLTLVTRPIDTPQALPNALNSLANDVEVLWAVPDPLVFSSYTAEAILLFSFRNRIPLAAFSSTWTKAGALYALDRDYHDIGVQCGELATKVLRGTSPRSLPFMSPRKVTYTINLRTANLMKIDIAQSLLDGAQQVFK